MNIISGIYWDRGQKNVNQDSVFLWQMMTRRGRVLVAGVSDGIGGLKEGEIASGYILERIREACYHNLTCFSRKTKGLRCLKNIMLRTLYDVSEELCKYADAKGIELGATLCLLVIVGRNYLVLHIGDSAVLKFHKNKGECLTPLHSDRKGGLLKAVGCFPFERPSIYKGRLKKHTGFLLASDGFYRKMPRNRELFYPNAITNERAVEKRLRDTGVFVKKNGEKDNISAIYVKVF